MTGKSLKRLKRGFWPHAAVKTRNHRLPLPRQPHPKQIASRPLRRQKQKAARKPIRHQIKNRIHPQKKLIKQEHSTRDLHQFRRLQRRFQTLARKPEILQGSQPGRNRTRRPCKTINSYQEEFAASPGFLAWKKHPSWKQKTVQFLDCFYF